MRRFPLGAYPEKGIWREHARDWAVLDSTVPAAVGEPRRRHGGDGWTTGAPMP